MADIIQYYNKKHTVHEDTNDPSLFIEISKNLK